MFTIRGKETENEKENRDAAAVILGILAVCYIGFAVFFQSHFCFGTTIDGIEAGGCSIAKVEQLIEEEIGGYELTLVEREDQTETITASQIGAARFPREIEELLADQNAFAWPGILFGKSALELEKTVAFDDTSFPGRSKRFPACRRRIRETGGCVLLRLFRSGRLYACPGGLRNDDR